MLVQASFGDVLAVIKHGRKARRAGWNGKKMWIAYSPGNAALPASSFWSAAATAFAERQPNGCAKVLPCILLKNASDEIVMGWNASQEDMLARDWEIFEAEDG